MVIAAHFLELGGLRQDAKICGDHSGLQEITGTSYHTKAPHVRHWSTQTTSATAGLGPFSVSLAPELKPRWLPMDEVSIGTQDRHWCFPGSTLRMISGMEPTWLSRRSHKTGRRDHYSAQHITTNKIRWNVIWSPSL